MFTCPFFLFAVISKVQWNDAFHLEEGLQVVGGFSFDLIEI